MSLEIRAPVSHHFLFWMLHDRRVMSNGTYGMSATGQTAKRLNGRNNTQSLYDRN